MAADFENQIQERVFDFILQLRYLFTVLSVCKLLLEVQVRELRILCIWTFMCVY